MTVLGAVLAFAILAALLVPKVERAMWVVVAASWVCLIGGFTWVYFAPVKDIASLIGIALFGAFAGLPVVVQNVSVQNTIVRFSSAFVIAVSATAMLALGSQPEGAFLQGQLLACAQWTALFAAGGNLCVATALRNQRSMTPMFAVAGAGAALGTIAAGMGRASLTDVGYSLSLRSGQEVIRYAIEPMTGLEQGMALAVAVPAESLSIGWIVLTCVAVAGAIWMLAKNGEWDRWIVAGTAGVSLTIGAALYSFIGKMNLPNGEPYQDAIKQALLREKIPGDAIQQASFSGITDLTVAFADLVPELFTLSFFVATALVYLVFRRPDDEDFAAESGYRRDVFARGVIWLWLGWLLALAFHGTTFGSPGILASVEWVSTGVCLFASGVLIATWSPTNKIVSICQSVGPSVVLAAIFFACAISYRFGTPFGLSMTVFR